MLTLMKKSQKLFFFAEKKIKVEKLKKKCVYLKLKALKVKT